MSEAEAKTITRTYRASIRIGEDFITLEEVVCLPLGATDEDISLAVDLGWRIYRAQREAVQEQVADVRGGAAQPMTIKEPDAPASDKQRNFIAKLQGDLGWSSEQLAVYAGEQGTDLVSLTKSQASTFIDGLKKLTEEQTSSTPAPPRTAREAEVRFFSRYQATINGSDWPAVQRYLKTRSPKPTTIEGWISAAEAVRGQS